MTAADVAGHLAHAIHDGGEAFTQGGEERAEKLEKAGAGFLCGFVGLPGSGCSIDQLLVTDGEVEVQGELVDTGLRVLQCGQSRQLQKQGHADGQDGEQGDSAQVLQQPPQALETAYLVANKAEEYENADKQAYVIIGCHGQGKAEGVQNKLLIPQQGDGAQSHQGQHGEAVQPHDVPVIGQTPGAHTVEGTEDGDGEIVLIKEPLQENGEEQSGKAQLQGCQQRKVLQGEIRRDENAEQIQGRGQVVGDQAQVINAHSDVPVINQGFAAEEGLAEIDEEGIVLVVHIGIEHGVIAAKGLGAAQEHHRQHP